MSETLVPVIVAARRTPIAASGGALAGIGAADLAAPVVRACVDDAAQAIGRSGPVDDSAQAVGWSEPGDGSAWGVGWPEASDGSAWGVGWAEAGDDAVRGVGWAEAVGDVVLGNCMGPGGNLGRVAALGAGLGHGVPGMTIDRQCGSGLAAIITAAEAIRAGDARLRVAGGVESCSTAPIRMSGGVAYRRAPFAPPGFPDPGMVRAAQDLADLDGIGRAQQDAYAARSHRLALRAQESGEYAAELVPLHGFATDAGPRRRLPAMLGRFPALFPDAVDGGTLTAGNSCRDSDGAAAVAIVGLRSQSRQGSTVGLDQVHDRGSTRGTTASLGSAPGSPASLGSTRGSTASLGSAAGSWGRVPGLAVRATATVGCDPALPGLGPAVAVRSLLDRAGIGLADVAAIEIVEAFAAQALASLTRLGLADGGDVDERVCAGGGALALGHPWGASAAVSVVRLFTRLVRAGAPAGTLGLATAAVGGGLGVAALFEVVR